MEADQYHSSENVSKMSSGQPLTDQVYTHFLFHNVVVANSLLYIMMSDRIDFPGWPLCMECCVSWRRSLLPAGEREGYVVCWPALG